MRAATLLLFVPVVISAAPVPRETDAQRLARVFGTTVDPNKDSTFAFDGARLTVTAGKGDHALHVQQGRMAAPRTLREVEGDFAVEVTAAAERPQGAKPALASRPFLFHSRGLLLWADDKTYVRLEHAHIDRLDGTTSAYVNYELFKEGEWTRSGRISDGTLDDAKPTRFRLARKGNGLVGSFSQDAGKTWTELEALSLELKATVQVGVTVNHNTDSPFAATFDEFTVTPAKK